MSVLPLIIAILLGFSILVLNALAFYDQKHSNPGPMLKPSETAKLTAILSIMFALLLMFATLM